MKKIDTDITASTPKLTTTQESRAIATDVVPSGSICGTPAALAPKYVITRINADVASAMSGNSNSSRSWRSTRQDADMIRMLLASIWSLSASEAHRPVGQTGGHPRWIQTAAATAANTASLPFTGSEPSSTISTSTAGI